MDPSPGFLRKARQFGQSLSSRLSLDFSIHKKWRHSSASSQSDAEPIIPVPNVPQPYITLASGTQVPQLAFGVGAVGKTEFNESYVRKTRLAIENGWRHIDAAEAYNTDAEVGVALQSFLPSRIPREDFFITTKVSPDIGIKRGDIEASLREELKLLHLDYVDLYLIHNPFFPGGRHIEDVWHQMEIIKDKGLAREIGLSNFGVEEVKRVLEVASLKPAVNQIEMHPYLYALDKATIDICHQNGIVIAGYAPLIAIGRYNGGPIVPVIEEISEKHRVTPAQVLLKWQTDKGHIVITGSSQPARQKNQLDLLSFSLDWEDMQKIESVGASCPFRFFGWGVFKTKYTPHI